MELASTILSIILLVLIIVESIIDHFNDKATKAKINELEKQIEELKKEVK